MVAMGSGGTSVAVATIEAPKAEAVMIGVPVADAVPQAMDRLGHRTAFLMVSQSLLRQTSVVADVQAALGSRCVGCYDGMPPHTPREAVVDAAEQVRRSGANVIVTIGGGSLTDAAKAIQIVIAYGATDAEGLGALRLGAQRQQPSVQNLPVRYIAVPTTLSGGEFSAFAGVTDSVRKIKEPYGHRHSAPQMIILDPVVALHTPLSLWLSTGMRAVDHAVEALCSLRANPYSSGLAQVGLQMLSQGLVRCKEIPQDASGRQLCQLGMWQATEAGMIAGAGASHAIGHTLGGTANVPHGHTSCVMLPAVLAWNQLRLSSHPGFDQVSVAMGQPQSSAAEAVRSLVQRLGLPLSLKDVGIGQDRFEQLAKVTMYDNALKSNPRPVKDWQDVVDILVLAAGGGGAPSSAASKSLAPRKGVIETPNGDPKTWQVGDCRVTRVIEMETIGGQEWIMPTATKDLARSVDWLSPHFADQRGNMKFAIQLMIVDAPGGIRIAVDTCVGNDKKRPLPNWHMRADPFLTHLEQAGITTESVTHVFCTHLHTDHIGWNTRMVEGKWVPTFPRAQYLFGKTEYEYWSGGGGAGEGGTEEGGIEEEMADSVLPIVDAGLARFVDTDHVLVDDGSTRVYLRPTLGHTPGHASLIIESQGAKAIITGDCFHHPIQLTKPWAGSRADTDSAQATLTREELLQELSGTPTLMFGTHFARPTVGTVVPNTENFKLDTDAADAHVVPPASASKL